MPLSASSTADDIATFLEDHLPPEPWVNEAASAARQANLSGAQLLQMTTDQAAHALNISVFGRKRKLALLLDKAKTGTSSPAGAAAATADGSVSTASSSSGVSAASAASASAASASAAAVSTSVAAASAAPSSTSAAAASTSAAAASAAAGSTSAAAGNVGEDVLHTAALDAATCDQALHDETYALGLVKWAGASLEKLLTKGEHSAWATAPVRASRLKELASLREQTAELPGVSIVVVGNTGAGKSTLLNALLGETSVLPTNGMRACTACLIEMRHEDSDPVRAPPYRAEIEFMTQQEWHKELDDLLDDLTPSDGSNQGRVNLSVSEESMAFGSWCKVFAVYGEDFTHSRVRTERRGPGDRVIYDNPTLESLKAKLRSCRTITHALSTTKDESATDAKTFRRKCERYMDSLRDVSGGSFWPLVKQVRLYSRQWTTLKTGAVLVDAPGVHDDNSARDAVVKKKLKDADAVWIVSNIVRAVNDKTAKDVRRRDSSSRGASPAL